MRLAANSGTPSAQGAIQANASAATAGKPPVAASALGFLDLLFSQTGQPQEEAAQREGNARKGQVAGPVEEFADTTPGALSLSRSKHANAALPSAAPAKREPATSAAYHLSIVIPAPVQPQIPPPPTKGKSVLQSPSSAVTALKLPASPIRPANTSPSGETMTSSAIATTRTGVHPVPIVPAQDSTPVKALPGTPPAEALLAGQEPEPPVFKVQGEAVTVRKPAVSAPQAVPAQTPVSPSPIVPPTPQPEMRAVTTVTDNLPTSQPAQKSTAKGFLASSDSKTGPAPTAGAASLVPGGAPSAMVAAVTAPHAAGWSAQPQAMPAVATAAAISHPAQTFERMDGAGTPATLLSSNPHEVSVGISDPLHGYLEIKTHLSAGNITASLAVATSEAHSSLLGHMPALGEYLAGQGVHVGSVSVERSGPSMGGGPQQGPGQQTPQGQQQQLRLASPTAPESDASPAAIPAMEPEELSAGYRGPSSSISIHV